MDAVLFIGFALFLAIYEMFFDKGDVDTGASAEIVTEDVTREAKINDAYYEDPAAFSEIINALGFPKG